MCTPRYSDCIFRMYICTFTCSNVRKDLKVEVFSLSF